jgi:hypothetical protein
MQGRVVDGLGRPRKIPNLSVNFERINRAPFDHASKGFAMVMRRSVIEEFMACWDWAEYVEFKARYGAPAGHDLLIYAWCVGRKKIGFLRQELVRYRVHGENVTPMSITNNRATKFLNFLRAGNEQIELLFAGSNGLLKPSSEILHAVQLLNKAGLNNLPDGARQSKLWPVVQRFMTAVLAQPLVQTAGILKTESAYRRARPNQIIE